MLLDVNYKFLGNINVTEKVLQLTEEVKKISWADDDFSRNEKALLAGKIIEYPYKISSQKHAEYSHLTGELSEEIVSHIQKIIPDGIFVRGEIAALLPGVNILPHIDNKDFHKISHRIHVPLITNEDCMNVFESEEIHFPAYSIFEINNRVLHHAYNNGLEPRIHLIFDVTTRELYDNRDSI